MDRHASIDLAEVRWYANAIENAGIQIFAVGDPDQLDQMRRLFKSTLHAMLAIPPVKPVGPPNCPWVICPDGSCRPDCRFDETVSPEDASYDAGGHA
jgi:hypothetical protein